MDSRFKALDKRFEELRTDMNSRFAAMQWLIGGGFSFLTIVMLVLKFLQGRKGRGFRIRVRISGPPPLVDTL
jgi:hypothetical protein